LAVDDPLIIFDGTTKMTTSRQNVSCAMVVIALAGTPAGAQTIRVAPVTEIARETEPHRFSEPHLAVQPGDPNHLLAAAFIIPASGNTETIHAGERCATFASRDGGSTWTRHEFPFVDCGDPQVAILPDGQAVFLALAEIPGLVPKRSSWLFALHSPDGGFTWDELPTVLGRPHDHPAVAIDTGSTARAGWVYVTTHHDPRDGNGRVSERLFVARSRDGGRSFDAPVTVRPNNLSTSGEMPVVLTDGTIVASFVDVPSLARRRAWVVRSSDGGTTFSEPLFVTDACGPPPGFQLSALAVDTSDGPFHDRLYFACRQSDGGRVIVTASGDRGDTWNRPGVEVGAGGTDTQARRVMTLAVNNRGVLGVLTVQRTASHDQCLATDFSASLDGGATFTPPARVSMSPCGTSPADEIAGRMAPTYGDYFGLVTTPDGRFRAVWPEMRDGHSVLLTAIVDVDTAAVRKPGDRDRF
jgi:BNR repeat-like domain